MVKRAFDLFSTIAPSRLTLFKLIMALGFAFSMRAFLMSTCSLYMYVEHDCYEKSDIIKFS